MLHFGLEVKEGKYGLKMARDKYAIIDNRNTICTRNQNIDDFTDSSRKYYTEEWCLDHQAKCLENYDLNMIFFSKLNHNDFNDKIEKFLKRYSKFEKVEDLNQYDQVSGYYMMILDLYCQLYIGVTGNILRRIRQHWNKRISFDRLLYPTNKIKNSVISINSFRALDTTRIYVYKSIMLDKEDEYIQFFPRKYVCNRIGGNIKDEGYLSYIRARDTTNFRNL